MRLIDADELMATLSHNCYPVQHDMTSIEPGMTLMGMLQAIQEQPTIEPQPRTGKWIHIRTEEDGNALYECSLCHMGEIHVPIVEVKYCWNCGAKMEDET